MVQAVEVRKKEGFGRSSKACLVLDARQRFSVERVWYSHVPTRAERESMALMS